MSLLTSGGAKSAGRWALIFSSLQPPIDTRNRTPSNLSLVYPACRTTARMTFLPVFTPLKQSAKTCLKKR